MDEGTNAAGGGLLRIKLLRATDLVAADSNGKSDPYVLLSVNDTTVRSKTVPKTLNPVWEELFSLRVTDSHKDVLQLRVMDWDAVTKDDPLGDATIGLSDLVDGEEKEMWVTLNNVSSGRVLLSMMAINCGKPRTDVGGEGLQASSPKTKKEKKEAKKEKRKAGEVRSNILDVVVLEGLDLVSSGKNSSPYCIVRLGTAVYVTSIKRNTNNCLWREDCSFKFSKRDTEVHFVVINEAAVPSDRIVSELRIPLSTIKANNHGSAQLYQLTSPTGQPTGYLRLKLQINPLSDGMLARYGTPFCATIPLRLNVGDIVLFSCSHIGAMVTKVSTASTWDHVAMIVKREDDSISVFESCPGGVRIIKYPDSFFNGYFEAGATVAIRRLTAELDDTALTSLASFVQQMDGKPYEKNLLEMVRGSLSLNSSENLSGVFCSELIAAAYQRMGLLDTSNASNNYMPAFFGKDNVQLLRGATLGPLVCFKPKRVRPAMQDAGRTHDA